MQQTETYKLKLIDTSDPFSPEPLNANARAIEAQLAAVRGEFAAADATLDGKLSAEKTRVDGRLSALDAAKAEKTALAAETAAREALAGLVGTLERSQLRWKYDTYTGTGISGPDHPTRLVFDFKPVAIIVGHPTSGTYGGRPWLRGMSQIMIYDNYAETFYANIIWEDRAVKWYYYSGNNDMQMNEKGIVYPYLAFGIAD